jgi:ABC-2 type transport system permease protein
VVAVFVRLKLTLLRNSLRGDATRTVLILLAIPFGVMVTGASFLGLAALRTLSLDDAAAGSAVFGTGVLLMWVVSPLVLFASDNTLDPARLVLLPLVTKDLMAGMAAAAWIGLPPLATVVALSGSVIGLGRSPVAVLAALLGVGLAAALCVFTSRAVATLLAGALRSRRGRDLGAVLLILLAGSIGVVFSVVPALLVQPGVFETVSAICRWTPPGLAMSAGADAAAGRWGMLTVDLGVSALTLLVVLFWWSRSLATALVTPTRAESARRSATPSALFPRGIGRWLPRTRAGAVFARELRYAWRSPYRRSSLALALVVGVFLGFAPGFVDNEVAGGAVFGGCWIAAAYAVSMANTLGYEGRSLWLHHVVPGSSLPDWGGRILAAVTIGAVPAVAVSTVGAASSGEWALLPAALGLTAVILGAECGVSAILGVLLPYPMPDADSNPFSTSSGGGVRAFLGVLAGFVMATVLGLPVIVLTIAGLAGWTPGLALAGIVGLGYAPLLVAAAGWLAAKLHDQRAPEVLAIVAPGRT